MRRRRMWAGALAAVVALPGAFLAPRASGAAVTPFETYLDCDPVTAGIQSACTFASGTTAVNIDVVFKNNSGAAASLGAFNFDVITNRQAIFNPATGVDADLNANPDFNQAAVTGTWACHPPLPNRDANPDPAIADSFLSCFNSAENGPAIANGGTIVIATVHYVVSGNGSGSFSLASVAIADNGLSELMSCNPVGDTGGSCFGASAGVGSAAWTKTPAPSDTPTPANRATETPGNAAAQATPTPPGGRVGAEGSRPGISLPPTGAGAIGASRGGAATAAGNPWWFWFAAAMSGAGGVMLAASARKHRAKS